MNFSNVFFLVETNATLFPPLTNKVSTGNPLLPVRIMLFLQSALALCCSTLCVARRVCHRHSDRTLEDRALCSVWHLNSTNIALFLAVFSSEGEYEYTALYLCECVSMHMCVCVSVHVCERVYVCVCVHEHVCV